MNRTGFALIGAGVIGEVHARNIAGHPDAHLRWVVDVDHARGGELAAAHGLRHLSMGTSQDYEVAVEEGATIVRLGSTLYR